MMNRSESLDRTKKMNRIRDTQSINRISRVKVLAGVFWHSVTDGNCVAARRDGEQAEVND